jgi:hypothetical protein
MPAKGFMEAWDGDGGPGTHKMTLAAVDTS